MKISVDTFIHMLRFDDQTIPCAIGKHGAIVAEYKREGDGRTPLGTYFLRSIYARPDRVVPFETELPLTWLTPQHGWCDDAQHPLYNQPVMLPFAASHENLWRDDGLYNIIVTLSHNDAPAMPHMGSAIFLHCCTYDEAGYIKPTLGCVAIAEADLCLLCAGFTPATQIAIV